MKNKKVIIFITMVFMLLIITVGVTFAVFIFSKEGQVENTIETSTVMLTYTEGKTGITLNEAYPISDEKGKILTGDNNVFDFTVQANLSRTMSIGYEVTAVKIPIADATPLEDNEVKLYLERAIDPDTSYSEVFSPSHFVPKENQSEIGSPIGSMILDSGTFTNEGITIHNYRLRLWVDEETQIPNGESRKYGVKINVYAKQNLYTEKSCFTFNQEVGTITDYSNDCTTDVVIPDTINGVRVTSIGNHAFANNQLTSVIIPDSVTSIDEYAFANNQLMSVIIPNSVTDIERWAFSNNQLTNVIIGDSVKTIKGYVFEKNPLTTVTIPSSVTRIDGYVFRDNSNLTTIINLTGKSFDWSFVIGNGKGNSFVTGTVGNITITDK